MTRIAHRRLISRLLGLAVLLAVGITASPAAANVVQQGDKRFGITRHARVSPSIRDRVARAADGSSGVLQYQGGPVLHSSTPYLVFWDPNSQIAAPSRALASKFFADVAHDSTANGNVYATVRQYTDSTGFADPQQTFDPVRQTITDSQAFPAPGGCGHTTAVLTTCLSDADVTAELNRLIGTLGLPTGTGPGAPIYFVMLPPTVNECSSGSSCATSDFCAYHSYTTAANGSKVLYAVMPSVSLAAGADTKNCQWDGNPAVQTPNHDPMDVMLTSISHEDVETITDPLLNAWINPATGSENADMCSQTGRYNPVGSSNPNSFLPTQGGNAAEASLYTQTLAGDHYYLQSEWSNGAGDCQAAPTRAALTAAATLTPAGSPLNLSLDPTATRSANGYSSVRWNFGDGSPELFTPTVHPTAVTHAFPRAGTFTVTLTVVDGVGNLSSIRQLIVVGAAPAAGFTLPAPHLVAGAPMTLSASVAHALSSGATLTTYSWNFGDGAAAAGATPSHTYARPGLYQVKLQVTDSLGQSATVTRDLRVGPVPHAHASRKNRGYTGKANARSGARRKLTRRAAR